MIFFVNYSITITPKILYIKPHKYTQIFTFIISVKQYLRKEGDFSKKEYFLRL